MNAKALVVALIGIGCVGAAGIGAYLAVRSATPAPVAATVERQTPEVTAQTPRAASPAPPAAEEGPRPSAIRPITAGDRVQSAPPPGRTNSQTPAPPPAPAVAMDDQAEAPVAAPAPVDVTPSAPEPTPARPIEERTLLADSVIGIRMDSSVSSNTARVEDRVTARVTRDVKIDSRTVVPAGAQLEGTVTAVERGGKVRGRSRIGIRFSTLVLSERERLPIQTDTIFRDGASPTGEATSKIGASAVVGTILGAVIGGKKGAAIGGATGAAGGTAVVMAGDRNEASIAVGTPLTVRLTAPVTVQVTREE